MHPEIQKRIEELRSALYVYSDDTTVSLRLFINYQEVSAEVEMRTPEQLKASGCSMRNLKGKWIA